MLLLLSSALAQVPQEFAPVPADVTIDGTAYSGILIDEKTYIELGQLRVLKREEETKLQLYEDWDTWVRNHYQLTISDMQKSCEAGQDKLVAHYETELEAERKRDFFTRHGFAIGVAAGLIGATTAYVVATDLYANVLSTN